MNFKSYLTGTIFWILLIWGPVNHSQSFRILIRAGYLFIIPAIIWILLTWIWQNWKPNNKIEILLERILLSLISISLLIFSFFEAISNYHTENNQQTQTINGMEDVGGYVTVKGANWGKVIIFVSAALLLFWFGVLKKSNKTSINTK